MSSRLSESETPDIVGPVYGWRVWAATGWPGSSLFRPLRSPMFFSAQWPTRGWLNAKCKNETSSTCSTPLKSPNGCICGIYMVDRPSHAIQRGATATHPWHDAVLGLAEGAGRYVRGAQGWRVGKARIRALVYVTDALHSDPPSHNGQSFCPRRVVQRYARRYNVPFFDASNMTATVELPVSWLDIDFLGGGRWWYGDRNTRVVTADEALDREVRALVER